MFPSPEMMLWVSDLAKTIAIEALLEAEAASPGSFTTEIHTALAAVEKFRVRTGAYANGGYSAWTWFEGNNDIYYGDFHHAPCLSFLD